MNTDGAGLISAILFLACCFFALIAFGFAAFNLFKTTKNFHPQREWGQYIPISIFSSYFFTEKGNSHRLKFIKSFLVFLLLIASAFGLAIVNENSYTKEKTQAPHSVSGNASN